MNSALYWPYDEVTVQSGQLTSEFVIQAPWVKTRAVVDSPGAARARKLADKYRDGTIQADDFGEINWFFRALSKFPLCYQLPRQEWEPDLDHHTIDDANLLNCTPAQFLTQVTPGAPVNPTLSWKWDVAGAIAFSSNGSGVDPCALYTVARRYHLISAIEENRTSALYHDVKLRVKDSEWFKNACALMVRQNHYVTQRCEGALLPALNRAQRATGKVQDFMQEERGHDRLLALSLNELGVTPESVLVTAESKLLMDLLEFSAKRNFLAFAIAIDMFEKSSYQEHDPLAEVLEFGGFSKAAKPINRHHNINDAGEHENVALGFLSRMGPVSPDYATEALRIAEATARAMNQMAEGVRRILDQSHS